MRDKIPRMLCKVCHFAVHTVWALLSLAFTAFLIIAVFSIYIEWQLPDVKTLRDAHLQVPLRIYTADGKLISQFGTKRRIPVTLNQVPKPLINAVLATEDARFYEHPGIDLIGMIRAAKAVITTGKCSQGASTITMQVARNFFLTRKKTYARKINEILLALKIDKELSKDKILELYLNKIYFGNRAYGVAAAAEVYYGKLLNHLTLPQMAMIAGLPQAPSRNNPLENPEAALKRRNHVLSRMYELGFINKKRYLEAIKKAPITAKYHAATTQVQAPYVAEMVREAVVDKYGEKAYDRGLTIYTTVSSKLQEEANRSLRDGLIAYEERHGYRKPQENLGAFNRATWIQALRKKPIIDGIFPAAVMVVESSSIQALLANGQIITIPWSGLSWAKPALKEGYVGSSPLKVSDIVVEGDVIEVIQTKNSQWRLTQIPQVEGALVALNSENGAILALVGGFNYGRSNFNRVIQAERQPGSNFKPFLYSAALAKGYTLATMINDAPVVMVDSGENSLWRPMNDTGKFYGPTSIRIGLIKSRNLVSIRLLQKIGIPYAIHYLERFGFNPNVLPHSLSLALGTASLSPLQIARGYAVFANGGFRVSPYFISRIEDRSHILYEVKPQKARGIFVTQPVLLAEQSPNPMAPQAITAQNAYLITQALRDVIRYGTGQGAKMLNRSDVAGKTGTTNNKIDAWFSGFISSHLETTVWVGYDNSRPLHEYGAQAALPIWVQFMHAALKGHPEATFLPQPSGMVTVRIDPHTGLLALPNQPDAIFEVFRQCYAPTKFSSTQSSGSSGGSLDTDSSKNEEEYLF